MKLFRTNFNGDPNPGLYSFATDSYCLLGFQPKKKILEKMKSVLKVDIKFSTIAGTELTGLFATGNSFGILLPKIINKQELKNIKEVNTLIIKAKETALGNLVVCNDKGCLISEKLKRYKKQIADCLMCEVDTGRIASLSIIGSSAVASNKGCLCHRETEEEEAKKIESLLKVKVDIGSMYGSPFVRSGIIVNSFGAVVSEQATGPELDRIIEIFE